MKVDNVLILAAGKGTRMGQVGKVVPKVIWPIFNKSILELEVHYAKKFNPNKIFINLYHSKNKIQSFCKDKDIFKNVEFIVENEALDIGGAVHNLAKKLDYKGNLLILNSDQFIILSSEKLAEFELSSKSASSTLLVYSVDPSSGYGGLKIKANRATGLIKGSEAKDKNELVTYTGMSCINLEDLNRCSGKSNFFKSVVNFEKDLVSVVNVDDCEYWDFGTLKRYKESMLKLGNSKDKFIDFLIESETKLSKAHGNENLKIDDRLSIRNGDLVFKN